MQSLLTADWHVRGDRPRCRTDENWIESQRKHIAFVVNYSNEHELPIVIVGDIFDKARVATEALNMIIQELKKSQFGVFLLAGNHDLPYHSYDKVDQCSYGVLKEIFGELGGDEELGAADILGPHNAMPFGLDLPQDQCEIVFTHQLVFESEEARPMEDCGKVPQDLLDEFTHAKWIFTGDYHVAFHYENDGRHVVNPGCLNRQVADKMDYQCQFAVIDTESEEPVKWVNIPDVEGEVITDVYLRDSEAKDDRLTEFLNLVESREKMSFSFRDNVIKTLTDNSIPETVKVEAMEILNKISPES